MATVRYVGRINQTQFAGATAFLLAIATLATIARFVVRLYLQKRFTLSVDDGFLLLGFCCMVIGFAILLKFTIDDLFLQEALLHNVPGVGYDAATIPRIFDAHKWTTVVLMINWITIMSVKFSFLFFFRKLLDRMRRLMMVWYAVLFFNICILGYGICVFYIACPYYYSLEAVSCNTGSGKSVVLAHSIASITLDVLSDAMILSIPIVIVWKLKRKWSQKLGLAASLFLTVFLMVVTIIRGAGILYNGQIDHVWETFWLIVSAQVGVFMAAVTAFRSFFVAARNKSRGSPKPPVYGSQGTNVSTFQSGKNTFYPRVASEQSWLDSMAMDEEFGVGLPYPVTTYQNVNNAPPRPPRSPQPDAQFQSEASPLAPHLDRMKSTEQLLPPQKQKETSDSSPLPQIAPVRRAARNSEMLRSNKLVSQGPKRAASLPTSGSLFEPASVPMDRVEIMVGFAGTEHPSLQETKRSRLPASAILPDPASVSMGRI